MADRHSQNGQGNGGRRHLLHERAKASEFHQDLLNDIEQSEGQPLAGAYDDE